MNRRMMVLTMAAALAAPGIAFGAGLPKDVAESHEAAELPELLGEFMALAVWFIFGAAGFDTLDGRLARKWGLSNEVALFLAWTNSAASSTTGAFRYFTGSLSARIGL